MRTNKNCRHQLIYKAQTQPGTPVITPVIPNPGQAFEIQAKARCKHATDLHFYYREISSSFQS